MQSKTTRGVRHLLVSTGVISLVLSVAAPAALADAGKAKGKSEPKNEHADDIDTGTVRIEICHNGRVIEVDDDGNLGGHSKHDDTPVVSETDRANCTASSGDSLEEGDHLVKVCADGEVEEIFESERNEAHIDPVLSEEDELTCPVDVIVGGDEAKVCVEGVLTEVSEVAADAVLPVLSEDDELTCPADVIVGGEKVKVCHEGAVIEIAAEALAEHVAHGDAEMTEGVTCPVVVIDEKVEEIGTEIDIDPVVVVGEPVVVEVPVKNPSTTPALPIPPAKPRPVVNISTDTVTKPAVPAQPASPAAAPKVEQNEVLGAVTTRTPTPGVGALDPGAHTAASITALAATGADGTKVLAVAGVLLLLSGFGLQTSGRRRMRSAAVEA